MKKNYSRNIIATLCYVVKNDMVLMLHRVKKKNDIHQGKYNGLGGKMEKFETPYECVIREVKEESGLNIKDPVLKGVLNFPDFDGKNNWIVFVYLAEKFNGKLKKSKEGDLKWVKLSELLNLCLWEGDKIFLKHVFKKGFFYGSFLYKRNKLVSYSFSLTEDVDYDGRY